LFLGILNKGVFICMRLNKKQKEQVQKRKFEIETELAEQRFDQEKYLLDRRFKEDQTEDGRRARGFTVGTAGGGTTEITMRGPGGQFLFHLAQPVEVVEIIHQLCANIGCHINIIPRKDFASWRDWRVTEEELAHARGQQALQGVGWPPFVSDINPHLQVGANMPNPDEQPGRALRNDKEHEDAVAIEKDINKRSSKSRRRTSK